MKRLLILFLLIFSFSYSYAEYEKYINKDDLPSVSQKFINIYYNGIEIKHCIMDEEWYRINRYEVLFVNGVKIIFDQYGVLKTIKTPIKGGLNLCFLPVVIRNYLIKNFYDCYVTCYSVKYRGKSNEEHEVSLSNGFKLAFNHNSNLIKVSR